jgi:hypothetical protein
MELEPISAEQMLMLIKAAPALLPVAPDHADADHIQHRRLDEVHSCFRCDGRSHYTFLVRVTGGTGEAKRWLDLCAGCTHWLRVAIDPYLRRA